MKKKKIKAVIFDVGGVLAISKKPLQKYRGRSHNLSVHEFIAKKLKISLDQYFDSIDTAYIKSFEGKFTKKQIAKILADNLKSNPEKIEKLYHQAYKKNFKQNKQLFKQAFELQKRGYKIAVLSDQWPLSYRTLMPKKNFKNFDQVIVSCEVGIRKPNPKIYHLTLRKLKLSPSETIFIDNQEWNLNPAKKIGMKTILFKDNQQLFENKTWMSLFEEKN